MNYREWREKALKDADVAASYIEELEAENKALREVEKAARDLAAYQDRDTGRWYCAGSIDDLWNALARLDEIRGRK